LFSYVNIKFAKVFNHYVFLWLNLVSILVILSLKSALQLQIMACIAII